MAKKKAKKKRGQPTKYNPKFNKIAEELCREKGYTDKNLAVHFKVSEATINNWKNKYLDFFESIKKGKDDFDSRVVEQSLLKRARGYSYNEITKEVSYSEDCEKLEGVLAVTKVVKKDVAPSDVAIIFWLKNRLPRRWSDVKEVEHRIEGITKPLTVEEMEKRLRAAKKAGSGIDNRSIEGANGNSS